MFKSFNLLSVVQKAKELKIFLETKPPTSQWVALPVCAGFATLVCIQLGVLAQMSSKSGEAVLV